jgi:two-component system, sensor histidine kinase and response regulator
MSDQRFKVLLIEDNLGDARLIQESLADAKSDPFDVETADRLETAVLRLRAGGIDAVLLDLSLPDSQGWDTFDNVKAEARYAPIIILTGLCDEALALRMVQEGAQDFVAKIELSGGVLPRAIRYAIERERSEQQIRKFNEELEERVRARTAELEAANQELEEFTSSVSHDLRGPLQRIDGFSSILEETHSSLLNPEGRKCLERIHKGVLEMAGIIESLLNLSRLGRRQLKMQPTSLNEVVALVLADLKAEIHDRQIVWKVGSLPLVECDEGLIKQVLINLIGNSVKYTRPRDVAVIEIGQTTVDGEQVIFVRDNGAGFDMKVADKLFGAFQRLHRHEDFEGTGVGLATVRRIVQRHGGRIWAEAELDKGATFYFTLGLGQVSLTAAGVR